MSGFMRRSASASSSLASSLQPLLPVHSMEPASKLQARSVSSFPAPHKTQLPSRAHFSPGHLGSGSWLGPCQRNVWVVVAAFIFCSVSLYAISLTRGVQYSASIGGAGRPGFGIVIDAGSSGSRVHVFKYTYEGRIPGVDLSYLVSKKVTPGLSSFESNPEGAGPSLIGLMEFSEAEVPVKEWASTRVYLMATAGLRLLKPDVRESILDSCRAELRKSRFLFKDDWASVISGVDEGIYAWVAANYVFDTLGHDPKETVGIVELGGASAQVTFVPDSPPPKDYRQTLELGGISYTLYTHSFLRLGQEAAQNGLLQSLYSGAIETTLPTVEHGVVVDPCTPKGYVRSTDEVAAQAASLPSEEKTILSAGNFAECRKAAVSLLKQGSDSCTFKRCAIGPNFIPKLRGKFFGTENFFYTSQFFGLSANATLAELKHAGEQFCDGEWSALQREHGQISPKELLKYCWSTSYIVALLHDSLGISLQDGSIKFTNQVGNVPLDWALGALIVKTGGGATLPFTL